MKKVIMTSLMLLLIMAAFSQKKDIKNTLPIAWSSLYQIISTSTSYNEQGVGKCEYFAIPETEFAIINHAANLDTLYSFSKTKLTFVEMLNVYQDCESAWKWWWVSLDSKRVGKFAIRTAKSDSFICDADQWPIGVCRFIPVSKGFD